MSRLPRPSASPARIEPMFKPENDLERALVRAAEDASARAPFFEKLIDAELTLALVESRDKKGGGYEVPEVMSDDVAFVPIFTADARVEAMFGLEKMMKVRQTFRQILEQIDGANFVLNPGSDYGREIMEADVAAMLAGDFEKAAESDDFSADSGFDEEQPLPQVVGRPSPVPNHLVKPLVKLFGGLREVKAVYLAQSLFPDADGLKRLVIGVECDGDLDVVLDHVGEVLDDVAKPSDVIDFVGVPGSPLDDYFAKDNQPIYRRP